MYSIYICIYIYHMYIYIYICIDIYLYIYILKIMYKYIYIYMIMCAWHPLKIWLVFDCTDGGTLGCRHSFTWFSAPNVTQQSTANGIKTIYSYIIHIIYTKGPIGQYNCPIGPYLIAF